MAVRQLNWLQWRARESSYHDFAHVSQSRPTQSQPEVTGAKLASPTFLFHETSSRLPDVAPLLGHGPRRPSRRLGPEHESEATRNSGYKCHQWQFPIRPMHEPVPFSILGWLRNICVSQLPCLPQNVASAIGQLSTATIPIESVHQATDYTGCCLNCRMRIVALMLPRIQPRGVVYVQNPTRFAVPPKTNTSSIHIFCVVSSLHQALRCGRSPRPQRGDILLGRLGELLLVHHVCLGSRVKRGQALNKMSCVHFGGNNLKNASQIEARDAIMWQQ